MIFQHNDAGRSTLGVKGSTKADCVVRAVTLATGQPYANVYAHMMYGTMHQRGG